MIPASFSGASLFTKGLGMSGTLAGGGGGASAGLLANPVGLALAGGQLAFGIGQMLAGNSAQEQQRLNEIYSTTYQNSINQWRVDQQNKLQAEAFSAKLGFVKDQIENNFLGAQASWTAEQMRLNETLDRAAYQSEALRKMVTESLGTSTAREVYGKSARRGALVANLGAYGRTRAQQVDQLMSETTQTQLRMQRTQQQMQAANKQALAQVAVLPQAQFFSPQQVPGAYSPGALNTALQIGGIGMQAFQAGWNVTPVKGSFLGIPKVA